MQEKRVNVAIIGAGTAGLSAVSEIKKVTDNFVLIDKGPLGTTCARIGCMPSKVLIQIAEDYFHRRHFSKEGIQGADKLTLNLPKALTYLRSLRDYFTSGVIKTINALGDKFIEGTASFLEPTVLQVNNTRIIAKSIIIATGSNSVLPTPWQKQFGNCLLTSDNLFEQETLSDKIAVIGAGVIGLELGQALSRLGIEIAMFHGAEFIGGLSDPLVNNYALTALREEFPLYLNEKAKVTATDNLLAVKTTKHHFEAKQVLAALGRQPNFTNLHLEKIGIKLDQERVHDYDCSTMQIGTLPVFLAGDAFSDRPLLHEAADEGRIAGYNAVNGKVEHFKRRVPLQIVFCQPNICVVGESYKKLNAQEVEIGEVYFDDQGRSRILSKNRGVLRVYADKKNGLLRGAEMFAPAGEHLAHMLAWAVQQKMTVFDVLQMPYYHPAIQEGMRTALRDLAAKVDQPCRKLELAMCESTAATGLR